MQNPNVISPVNVALLYQTGQFETHLKAALSELGADVVYEAATARVDRDALEESGAHVVIVNLDPEIESHLDEVYDLLDDARYNVVFNDGTVSSSLSGWDQARWARHLAAKVLGRPDVVDPPRPAGAEAPRSPVQRVAERILDAGERTAPVVPYDMTNPTPSPYAGDLEIDAALDELLAHADGVAESLRPVQPDPGEVLPLERHTEPVREVDVDAESRVSAESILPSTTPVPPPPASRSESVDFASELDVLIGSVPASSLASDTALAGDSNLGAELDALFVVAPMEEAADSVFDAMEFDSVEISTDDTVGNTEFTAAFEMLSDDAEAKPDESKAGLGAFTDWALESFDVNEAASPFAKPVAPQTPAASTFSVEKVSAESFLSGDWSLEDLDDDAPIATASKPAEFGIEKIAAQEYLAPKGGEEDAFADFDDGAKLDLVPMEEAVSPRSEYMVEYRLDEAVVGTPRGVVKRVIVLGASIGGPEAVREFLAELPPRFPALFLLAQHMSAEFLELMSAQLAKTTSLTVRNPTHGERVGHGDIVVVPTAHRLLVDADGVVQLTQPEETSGYSPSIDQVLRDVADRFGAHATAIIFSGMAHDAVEGAKYLVEKGGTVWAQDPDTCVTSTMVDGARAAGVVSFLAAPQQLAHHLLETYAKT